MPRRPLVIAHDHPAFAGHFPGQPVVPGVVLLAEVVETLQAALQATHPSRVLAAPLQVGAVKFVAPVGPGARLHIDWTCTAQRVRFELTEDAEQAAGPDGTGGPQLVASGQLDLSDALDETA